jgi:hypothetical protein
LYWLLQDYGGGAANGRFHSHFGGFIMKIEKRREQELAKRQGNARRTVIQGIWLLIALAFSYFMLTYLNNEKIFTTGMIRNAFNIPRTIPEWAVLGGMMIVLTLIIQFFLSAGYLLASPQGRRKPGRGDMYSSNPDPFDDR